MVNGFRCCKVVLTITTERGDAIVEVSSTQIVSGFIVLYDDATPRAVGIAICINMSYMGMWK